MKDRRPASRATAALAMVVSHVGHCSQLKAERRVREAAEREEEHRRRAQGGGEGSAGMPPWTPVELRFDVAWLREEMQVGAGRGGICDPGGSTSIVWRAVSSERTVAPCCSL